MPFLESTRVAILNLGGSEEHRRHVKKSRRALVTKVAAIAVALCWLNFGKAAWYNEEKLKQSGYASIAIWAFVVYFVTWAFVRFSHHKFGNLAFEQFTLFAAEFTAFLWRDGTTGIRHVLHMENDSKGWIDGMLYLVFAFILFWFGLGFVALMKRARKHRFFAPRIDDEQLQAEHIKHIDQAMHDVDYDAASLAPGWAIQAALSSWLLGPHHWKQFQETPYTDSRLMWIRFGIWPIGVFLVVSLVLSGIEVMGYTQEEGRSIEGMLRHTAGWCCGFFWNSFWMAAFYCSCETISHHACSPDKGMFEGITICGQPGFRWHLVLYPVFMSVIGLFISVRIAEYRGEARQGGSTWARCCPSWPERLTPSPEFVNRAKLDMKKIAILSFQVCCALAFEGMLDQIGDILVSNPTSESEEEDICKKLEKEAETGEEADDDDKWAGFLAMALLLTCFWLIYHFIRWVIHVTCKRMGNPNWCVDEEEGEEAEDAVDRFIRETGD